MDAMDAPRGAGVTPIALTTRRAPSRIAKLQGYVVRGVTGSMRATPAGDASMPSTRRSQLRLVRPTLASKMASRTASGTATPTLPDWTSTLGDAFNASSATPGNESAALFSNDLFAPNATWHCPFNESDLSNGSHCANGTHPGGQLGPNDYWALLLLLFPVLTVFGNVLVILSVYRERTLQNATNYFIISLAIADLLVATLVMPFAVYAMVTARLDSHASDTTSRE